MNIEILTTKKKLSKSIIKQLDPATEFDLSYIVNVVKIGFYVRDIGIGGAKRTGLFESNSKWVLLPLLDWKISENNTRITARNECGAGCFINDFDTLEHRDRWISAYCEAKKLCEKNHLIL